MSSPRKVICTSAHGLEAELLALAREPFQAYAARHGWAYVEGAGAADGRPDSWRRIALLRELGEQYDAVLWLAPDVLIADHRTDVAGELRDDAVLALAEREATTDGGGGPGARIPDTGVLLLRGGDESARLLDWIWNATEYIDHPRAEQAALLDVLGWDVEALRARRRTWAAQRTQTLDARWNATPRTAGARFLGGHDAGQPLGASHEQRLAALAEGLARFRREVPQRATRPAAAVAEPAIERTQPVPICVIRGERGALHSLAHVNDGLGGALAARGHAVVPQPPTAAALPLPCATVSHTWPPLFTPGTDGPTVVVLPWEYHAPPRSWVAEVRARVDRVWVPSAFVRDGYVAAGMPPEVVDVVPNGVALDRFAPDGPSLELDRLAAGDGVRLVTERPATPAPCTFLFVGGAIWRKGVDVLLEAWERAFGPDDDVRLVIKDFGLDGAYRGQSCGPRVRAMAERDDLAPLLYVDAQLEAGELPALYRSADVLVAPYRGEGFCLPVLEAMACAVPAMHTAAGPTGEFCPPEAGWPLPSRREQLDVDSDSQGPLTGLAWTFEVDPDVLAATLRAAAADAGERAARGRAARRAAERYGWDAVAEIAERRLAELAQLPPLRWARAVAPARLETRASSVLYTLDWTRPERWRPALSAWAHAFSAADDVTLVLAMRDGDHGAVAEQVVDCLTASGRPEQELPDVLLSEPAWTGSHALVARCDAVLLDAGSDAGARALLSARAPRTVEATPEAIAALAAELCAPAVAV
jgi:glycosyltransferase involved in cell wall biosynthesis